MNKTTYTATQFELAEDFFVDVLEENGVIEFYLYRKNYGFKMFMFGINKKDAPPETWEEVIAANAGNYTDTYIDEYEF